MTREEVLELVFGFTWRWGVDLATRGRTQGPTFINEKGEIELTIDGKVWKVLVQEK